MSFVIFAMYSLCAFEEAWLALRKRPSWFVFAMGVSSFFVLNNLVSGNFRHAFLPCVSLTPSTFGDNRSALENLFECGMHNSDMYFALVHVTNFTKL